MKSHDLAKILLENENLDVSTHANNHTHNGADDRFDSLRVGIMEGAGRTILIGNFSRKKINYPNDYVTDIIHGDAPDNWMTWR